MELKTSCSPVQSQLKAERAREPWDGVRANQFIRLIRVVSPARGPETYNIHLPLRLETLTLHITEYEMGLPRDNGVSHRLPTFPSRILRVGLKPIK